MKKIRLGLLTIMSCLLLGGMVASAETKTFSFVISPTMYDESTWTASKADSEQTAYITPTSITGSGRIWAAVYGTAGEGQCTADVGIQSGEQNVKKTTAYYKTGYAGRTYQLIGGDSEWEVTSSSFRVSGRWTP